MLMMYRRLRDEASTRLVVHRQNSFQVDSKQHPQTSLTMPPPLPVRATALKQLLPRASSQLERSFLYVLKK
jgi:hypothetical protein